MWLGRRLRWFAWIREWVQWLLLDSIFYLGPAWGQLGVDVVTTLFKQIFNLYGISCTGAVEYITLHFLDNSFESLCIMAESIVVVSPSELLSLAESSASCAPTAGAASASFDPNKCIWIVLQIHNTPLVIFNSFRLTLFLGLLHFLWYQAIAEGNIDFTFIELKYYELYYYSIILLHTWPYLVRFTPPGNSVICRLLFIPFLGCLGF